MFYQIIQIIKIIIVALNRNNLLTGKDNNKLNKIIDSYEDSRKRFDKGVKAQRKSLNKLKKD